MANTDDDNFSATTVSAGHLRAIVERIERLEEEKKEVGEQIKEVYVEAKGNGFDAKTIRKIVSLRKKSPEQRSEEEAMLELYMNALGMLPGGGPRHEPPLSFPAPLPVQQKGRKPLAPTVVAMGPSVSDDLRRDLDDKAALVGAAWVEPTAEEVNEGVVAVLVDRAGGRNPVTVGRDTRAGAPGVASSTRPTEPASPEPEPVAPKTRAKAPTKTRSKRSAPKAQGVEQNLSDAAQRWATEQSAGRA